ncbi:MAG: PepSY-associated TM helix domain-containing protein, partial [Bacteroidota bacterium]
ANWQSVEAAEHHHDGLGDFLYHLHYFEPIPVVGIYLSGLVGVFFLLAIVTGIIVHWKKIRSNFFTFRLKATIKNLWTDAHTALGVIGLPFQLMYAVTGALFGLTILIFMPSVMLLFDGDQEAMIGYVYPAYTTYELEGPLNQTTADASQEYLSVNKLVNEYLAEFKDEEIRYVNVSLQNYQDRNAHLLVMLDTEPKKRFYSQAYKIFRLRDGLVVREKGLDQNPHNESVVNFVHFIHFGSFGGYFIKGFYFIMALITCFVIISGVLVWLKARDMKKYAAKAKFNTNVGALYLGISLGLFPSIAFIFCLAKILPLEMADRMTTMETIFFLFWLGYSVYSFIQKDYFKISRNAFALAGIIGLAVPVLNGIQTGMWFWQAIPMAYLDVAMIDISWLVIGGVSIATAYYMKPVIDKKKLKKQEAQVLEPA